MNVEDILGWTFVVQWLIGWAAAFWWLEYHINAPENLAFSARETPAGFAGMVAISWVLGVIFLPCCAWYWLWRLTIGRGAPT